jgi:protein kinase C substrate 80K-H
VFEVASYLPESFLPAYEEFKDTLVSWLQKFGVVSGGGDGAGRLIAFTTSYFQI